MRQDKRAIGWGNDDKMCTVPIGTWFVWWHHTGCRMRIGFETRGRKHGWEEAQQEAPEAHLGRRNHTQASIPTLTATTVIQATHVQVDNVDRHLDAWKENSVQ